MNPAQSAGDADGLLVVVDVQHHFVERVKIKHGNEAAAEMIAGIKKLLALLPRVVFLELADDFAGWTVGELLSLGQQVEVIKKSFDDGSYLIDPERRFYVCGLNLDSCVKDTAYGLAGRYPESRIFIVLDASHTGNVDYFQAVELLEDRPLNCEVINVEEIANRIAGKS